MAAVSVEVNGEGWGGEASGNLLQTFWDLSSLEEQKRLQAAKKLVSGLRECQVHKVTIHYVYYVAIVHSNRRDNRANIKVISHGGVT